MDIKQNPFSLYDFLGYFIPGAIFLYGILAVIGHVDPDATSIGYITEFLSFDEKFEIYIPFVLASYAIGHILSFISSIIVERFSIWVHGYPSKYLLGFSPPGFFNVTEKKYIRWFLRLLVGILLLPIAAFDYIFGKLLGFRDLYAKKLDELLIDLIKIKMRILFENSGVDMEKKYDGDIHALNFFRYGEHFALENAPHHIPKMHNYIALYGFLRTLTLISIAVFWCFLIHIFVGSFSLSLSIFIILVSSGISYVLYMGFIKFYRRYSLEVMMAISVIIKYESNSKTSSVK